jgi:hypothetical protein
MVAPVKKETLRVYPEPSLAVSVKSEEYPGHPSSPKTD